MKKVVKKMWLDVICVVLGVLSFSLLGVAYKTSMILAFIFSLLYMINLLHNLNNRKYVTNFLCNLVMVGDLIILSNSIDYLKNGNLEINNYALSYLLIMIVLGNILDIVVHNRSIKKKDIEFNLNTKNNKYLMLINLVNIFLVILFVLEENLLTSSVLFMFVVYLILIIPMVYYFKRKHYICGSVLALELVVNYALLIYFVVAFYTDKSASINYLLMAPLYGVILIPLSIFPINCIKYKKEHLQNNV